MMAVTWNPSYCRTSASDPWTATYMYGDETAASTSQWLAVPYMATATAATTSVNTISYAFGVKSWATTGTATLRWITPNGWAEAPRQSNGERLSEIIRMRQAPMYLPSHRKLLLPTVNERELRARATFRRIVGEHNWRMYCAKGFVSVRAKSGRVYQLFAGHDVTRVYENGRLTERLCIVLSGDYPPTDAILMRYVLVLSDEATFRRVANHTVARFNERDVVRASEAPTRDLVAEWRDLKQRRNGYAMAMVA